MTNEEYIQTQLQLQALTTILLSMNLEGFLDRIEIADTMGPMLDPTLYNKAGANFRTVQQIAREVYKCQQKLVRITEQHEETVT